jgi:RimJ/RimL family protein N-acetyltransferase
MRVMLETERLLLREFTLDDVPVFHRMVTDPDVTRYTGDQGKARTLEEVRAGLTERVLGDYARHGYGRWAAVYRPDNAVIGFAGLKYLPDVGETDLGYRFFKEYWGRGLATEAARALMDWGFAHLPLHRYIGIADSENVASCRVLEKVGFRFVRRTTYQGFDVAWYEINKPA